MLDGMTALGFMAAHSEQGAHRPHGRRHPLPAARTLDQGAHHARRSDRRAGLVRDRRGLERGGVARPGLPHAAAAGALRVAGGHAADGLRHVERRVGQRRALRGQAGHRHAPAELAAGHQPAASADHDRRRWGAEDAAPGGAVRRACNVFGGPERITHKYAVLREHCERLGRPTTRSSVDLQASTWIRIAGEVVDRFGRSARPAASIPLQPARRGRRRKLERLGAEVFPQLR